jgi:hypothetical protein
MDPAMIEPTVALHPEVIALLHGLERGREGMTLSFGALASFSARASRSSIGDRRACVADLLIVGMRVLSTEGAHGMPLANQLADLCAALLADAKSGDDSFQLDLAPPKPVPHRAPVLGARPPDGTIKLSTLAARAHADGITALPDRGPQRRVRR